MLEIHRCRHVDWKPSPVVALATSVDGAVVAAARENGAIEVWIVAPGSVGWHCQLNIPGKRDAAISSLLWCTSNAKNGFPWGRLFSAGLDGFISEWDLSTLQPKGVVKAYGGSVWQMASEPFHKLMKDEAVVRTKRPARGEQNSGFINDDDNNFGSDAEEVEAFREQKVAVGCDDGCVRLFEVNDETEGMIYRHSFPGVPGRILSVAWNVDATRVFSGGSDGCIRCWDVGRYQEIYRITTGLGGEGSGSDLCVWSLLTLRDGTVVSGDSTGSTQFWDGRQGTLLQAHTCHGADVLALATAPSHGSVFAAGADGQVVQYQLVSEGNRLADGVSTSGLDDVTRVGDKWVFIGKKGAHSHDVRALAVAFPIAEGESVHKSPKKRKRIKMSLLEQQCPKWAQPGVPMLVSGGNDAKLFAYPANAFLAFHPHDICAAPQQMFIQLSLETKVQNGIMMMVQHQHWIDIWKVHIEGPGWQRAPNSMGGRKLQGFGMRESHKYCKTPDSYRGAMHISGMKVPELSNGHGQSSLIAKNSKQLGKLKGSSPELLVRIKCKSVEHISCSALSGNGKLVAFSDQLKPRLFGLVQQRANNASELEHWLIKKKKLPGNLPAAHSVAFSADSTRLLLACPQNMIYVVDIDIAKILHRFEVGIGEPKRDSVRMSPITKVCTSVDDQWLATSNSLGDVTIFNLETFRQHWCIPPLDGSPVTALTFHPGSSSVLILSTSANQLHVLDVEARRVGEWSLQNGSRLPKRFLEFPGGIQGLSMPPSRKSTSLIAYSPRAMCMIDFKKQVPQEAATATQNTISGLGEIADRKVHSLSNGAIIVPKEASGLADRNFVILPFKDPVLFLGHVAENSVMVVEKSWLDVLHQLPPPVYRHLYGT